ncbi:phosphoglucosamine mutase [Stratiformator vulcanicus]|uniref:Phosphoglucosamine mutase n=1 Tax=Stratiformator vulcanicus TaxID=2527980 RepID=A0A517R318_9PLAN|nr:phosphoglucosamine mutase [Stratiformator vulcanicus]QDT38243.1 Phosphoglucosamine mutase [Stratiformator vulcanicus]
MPTRILSISGLRGIVGDGLDPEYVVRFAAGVGTFANGGPVVLSRDGRATGQMLKHAAVAGLTAAGCKVLDAGVATTPTCGVLICHHRAAAGLQITASHNPIEWNGLKPFSGRGGVLNADEGKRLLDILEGNRIEYRDHAGVGDVVALDDPAGPHIDAVTSLVDVAAIRKRRFKVVLDCCNGAGAVSTPQFLRVSLGCEAAILGGTADGRFEHTPEPLAENLTGLSDAVRQTGADVGFAQDPDADRLAIVDENGHYIGEELTLALAVDYVLGKRKGPVVVNGSTSRVSADLAARHGCEFFRSAVGEANVVTKMREVDAVLGGEGNGGVIEPIVGPVRDSYVSMAYVLAGLAERGSTLSEWVATLPKYEIVKRKVSCDRNQVERVCDSLKSSFADAEVTEGDGLRLDWSDRWVQVRASNTEPIARVIAEAPKAEEAQTLAEQAMQIVQKSVS